MLYNIYCPMRVYCMYCMWLELDSLYKKLGDNIIAFCEKIIYIYIKR